MKIMSPVQPARLLRFDAMFLVFLLFSFAGCGKSPRDYFEKGNEYHLRGEYLKAVEMYNRAVLARPDFPEALNSRGLTYERLKNRTKSRQDYERAVRVAPEYMQSYANLAGIYMDSGFYEKALYYLNKAVSVSPGYPHAYLNRGIVRYKMNDMTAALADFSKTLEIDPKLELPYYYRALIYSSFSKHDKAIENLNILLEINDNLPLARFERGKAFFKTGDFKSAAADFARAASIKRSAIYKYWEGLALYKMKYYEGAMNAAEEAAKESPDFALARLLSGDIFLSLGEWRRALGMYKLARKLDPAGIKIYDKRIKYAEKKLAK